MADFEKKVSLIEVEIDNKAADAALNSLTSSIIAQTDAVKSNADEIKSLEKANKDLQKQVDDGTKTQDEANKAIAENNKRTFEIKKTNASLKDGIKDLNKERQGAVKATKLQSNSLDALRKKSVDLKKELNAQGTATADGRKKFDKLTEALEKNNKQITQLDQAAGDYKTTVGQYKNELKGAEKGTKVFGGALDGVGKMILLNPFALLVGALVGLVAIFKKSQSGAEFFRKAGAALNVVFGILSDVVEALGNSMIEAFSKPQETLNDLVDTIKNGVMKYFTEFIPNAINKVIGGFKLLGEALVTLDFDKAVEGGKMLVDGMTDIVPVTALMKVAFEELTPIIGEYVDKINEGTEAAFNLEQQLIANEKAQADNVVTTAQALALEKELNQIVEDQSKAFGDRIAAAERFSEVEAGILERSIGLQLKRIEIIKAQNALTNSTEEDVQRLRDAEQKLAEIRAASSERQLTNDNKLFAIRKQRADEILKAEEEAEEKRMERISKSIENMIEENELIDEAQTKIDSDKIDKAGKVAEIIKKINEGINKAVLAGLDVANNNQKKRHQQRFKELEKQLKSGAITEEQFAAQKAKLEKHQAMEGYALQKKKFMADKLLAIKDIVVKTAQSVSASAKVGFPAAIPMIAASVIGGVIQGAIVATQQPPSPPTFAQGGDVFGFLAGGKDHSAGGTEYKGEDGNVFKVQSNEGIFVTKREATNPALQMLNEANTAHGGRSMFASSSRFLQDGGEANQEGDNASIRAIMVELLENAPPPVVDVRSIMGGLNVENEANEIGLI